MPNQWLGKENAELRERLAKSGVSSETFSGLTFQQMYDWLAAEPIDGLGIGEKYLGWLCQIANAFGDPEPALLHLLWDQREEHLRGGVIQVLPEEGPALPSSYTVNHDIAKYAQALRRLGLGTRAEPFDQKRVRIPLSEAGHAFLLQLMARKRTSEAEEATRPDDIAWWAPNR
jgi:hypothetical protein